MKGGKCFEEKASETSRSLFFYSVGTLQDSDLWELQHQPSKNVASEVIQSLIAECRYWPFPVCEDHKTSLIIDFVR